MAEVIAVLSNTLVTAVLIAYIVILWLSLTIWTSMDIFSRSKNWFVRIGGILLVGLGFFFGFVLYLMIRPQTTIEDSKVKELEERILESQTKLAVCPRCSEFLREDFLFCASCGLALKRDCPKCSSKVDLSWSQCPYCGIALGETLLPKIKETESLPAAKGRSIFSPLVKLFASPKLIQPTEVKRGRGRPRKPVVENPEPRRPRGRPRKNVIVD